MELKALAEYKYWADNLLYGCLAELSEAELRRDRPMLFSNILSLLHHVYAMDVVWRSNLESVPHNLQTRNPEVRDSFKELRNNQNEINSWYEHYFARLDHGEQIARISFNYIGEGSGVMSRAEILQHAVNHSSYHRGHIEGVLYQMSIEPPTTDITIFLKNRNAS